MKLNVRPNGRHSQMGLVATQRQVCARLAVSILLGSTVTCLGAQAGERPTNSSAQRQPEVSNLRLESDFRAVRLLWSYEPAGVEQEAAAFDVRYCELTSWNIEIKCRHRELGLAEADDNNNHNHSTVIEPAGGLARRLDRTSYEAQIFDLRALTNYTFQVQVARLRHQPQVRLNLSQATPASRRQEGGRGLEAQPERLARVETKAFAAEATKCLAESSEVVVQTGRHFGGRISVEDSADARCQLLGNRSSEQTSYLFRIDHQACQSRLVDGSRIETMVLVHENRDILTHNTARFLVLCNFQQRAFTLRASVSLPRVQGQLTGERPAATAPARVTPLGARPVMLGSMPGLYRSLASYEEASRREQLQELETNTISGSQSRPAKEQPQRQSKGLTGDKSPVEARSLLPPAPPVAPQPVQVQSKVLYVERGAEGSLSARSGRQHHLHPKLLVASQRHSNATLEPTTSSGQTPIGSPIGADPKQLLSSASPIAGSDELATPIIMTNNHRLNLAGQQQMEMSTSHQRRGELAGGQLRARSGRMRNMEAAVNRMGEVASSPADELSAAETSAELRQLVVAAPLPSANLSESAQVAGGLTLAQNLTSYLLKWSLKQLTSLARKSLESLAVANETTLEEDSGRMLDVRGELKAPTRAPWSPAPAPTTTASASDTTSVRWPPAEEETTTTTRTTTSTEAARTAKEDDDGFITSGGGDKSVDLWPPVSAREPDKRLETGELGQQRRGSVLLGLVAAGALLAGLLLVACFALARPRRRPQASEQQERPPQQEQSSYRKCGGELVYGKLGGCSSPASANRLLLLDDARSASSLSPEADCRTSELLFNQHVLVRTDQAPGESYA